MISTCAQLQQMTLVSLVLVSVWLIRIWIPDPDRHQNLIVCSLAHWQPSLKISRKSVRKFLHKVANRQTDRQTDKQRRKHYLLGWGNQVTGLSVTKTKNVFRNNRLILVNYINSVASVTLTLYSWLLNYCK